MNLNLASNVASPNPGAVQAPPCRLGRWPEHEEHHDPPGE